jgi:hypothetical protein
MPATTPRPPSSEQVAAFDRNAWSRSIGIPGRNPRNPHRACRQRLFGADKSRFSGASMDVTLQAALYHRFYQNRSAKPLILLNCFGYQALRRAVVPRAESNPELKVTIPALAYLVRSWPLALSRPSASTSWFASRRRLLASSESSFFSACWRVSTAGMSLTN